MFETRSVAILLVLVSLALPSLVHGGEPGSLLGTWRLTTLVDQEAERLQGEGGSYEMIVGRHGERLLAAVAKVGHTGKKYAPADVLTGVAEVQVEQEAGRLVGLRFTITLASQSGSRQSMLFELGLDGESLLGFWAITSDGEREQADEADAVDYTVFGAARAERGSGKPVRLGPDTPLPCRLGCDIRYRCGGMGPGACNSSNTCRDACSSGGREGK